MSERIFEYNLKSLRDINQSSPESDNIYTYLGGPFEYDIQSLLDVNDPIPQKGQSIFFKGGDTGFGYPGQVFYNPYANVMSSTVDNWGATPAKDGAAMDTLFGKGYQYCGTYRQYIAPTHVLVYVNDTYELDTIAETWTEKTASSTDKRMLASTPISDKSYIYGGHGDFWVDFERFQDTEEYDSVGDSWVSKTDLPGPARDRLCASTILNKGYIYSGASDNPNPAQGWPLPLADTDEYNATGNSWVNKTDLSSARRNAAASTILDKGYIYGGYIDEASPVQQKLCDEYNSTGNSWTSKTDLPADRWGMGASTVSDKAYLYGGAYTNPAGTRESVHEYNPVSNTWKTKTQYYSSATSWGNTFSTAI